MELLRRILRTLLAVTLVVGVSAVLFYRNELREARQTILISAAARGNINEMRFLLWFGADVNSKESREGLTPLSSAAFNRRREPVEFLISEGADVHHVDNREALGTTAYFGYLETATALLDAGADVNAKFGEHSALVIASENGYIEVVRLLVERGADIRSNGEPAIKKALIRGHPDIVDLLIEKGVNVGTMPTELDSTLFEYADHTPKKENKARMIESLRRAGARER